MFPDRICATLLLHVFGAGVNVDALGLNQPGVPTEADVVIIGAGYAGLSAARDLVAAGLQVVVFEGLDRAGGRTRNHNVPGASLDRGGNPEVVEVGAQWLGTREVHPEAWQLIVDELGFELYDTPGASSNQDGGHTVASTSKGTQFGLYGLGWGNSAELAWAVLQATIEKGMVPWMGSLRDKLSAMTFSDWMEEKGVDGDAAQMMNVFICECGEDPSKVSALDAVYQLNAKELATSGATATHRIKGGFGGPVLAMVEELRSIVHFNSQVVAIDQDEDTASVVVEQNGVGAEVRAQRVMFSGSPYTTLNVNFTPPLPQEKQEVLGRLRNGQTVKPHLVYNRPFWRESNLSGSIVNVVNLEDNFTACFDNTPPDSNFGMIACLAQNEFGRKFALLSEDERRDRMANFLASHFNDDSALQPIWYTDFDWQSQPLFQGGCMGLWPPSTNATSLNQDFRRVSWIGSDLEADPDHFSRRGYVESAIITGRATARRFISAFVSEL